MSLSRALIIIGLVLGAATPAAAELKLCNQTSYILYTAAGSATKTVLDVRGWTRIVPGDCAIPIATPLVAPAYFIYARTSLAHAGAPRAWGGGVQICARDMNFIQHAKLPVRGCPAGEYYKMPFALVDRHARTSWKTNFTESPALKTLKEARHAGVNRLLEDLGYHVSVPGDRARDQALEDFHKKAKLPADTNEAELFLALETAATKAVSPAGYTVCNSIDQPLWVAIGIAAQKGAVSRGWWQVPRGGCSRVITQPLHGDRIFVLAQRKGKPPLVSGPVQLCVDDTEFDLPPNAPCNGKGFRKAGFAATDTKGRGGYVAVIGDIGLVAPAQPGGKKPNGR